MNFTNYNTTNYKIYEVVTVRLQLLAYSGTPRSTIAFA